MDTSQVSRFSLKRHQASGEYLAVRQALDVYGMSFDELAAKMLGSPDVGETVQP